MGNSNSTRNFKTLRKSFRRAGSSEQIISSFKKNPKISTGSLSSGSTSSKRNADYSRSHSLASNTTSSDVSSRVSVGPMDDHQDQLHIHRNCDMDTPLVEIPPKMLTPEQLIVIKYTWHLVLNDTSNICLNFFHQLQRRFPHIKRLQKADHLANSTPSLPSSVKLMTRNRSCTTENNHQNKQSLLPQHALKLACCIDSLIGSLIRNHLVVEDKVIFMLEEAGIIFKTFLGFNSLYNDTFTVREMSNAFSESLRLILVHNCAEIQWNEDFKSAWAALFQILLYHLDGNEDLWE